MSGSPVQPQVGWEVTYVVEDDECWREVVAVLDERQCGVGAVEAAQPTDGWRIHRVAYRPRDRVGVGDEDLVGVGRRPRSGRGRDATEPGR